MPELPEVEVQRRAVSRWLKGRSVVRTEGAPSRTFRGADLSRFVALRGKLLSAERKGKYLLFSFEKGQGLMAHLGMTGKFLKREQGETILHSRGRFILDDGTVIHYRDPRMFGQLLPVPADELWNLPAIRALGADLLNENVAPAQLKKAIVPSKQPLKVALMDQSRIAGLGNIHATEALYRAKIHPARQPESLTDAEWRKLTQHIHAALQYALDHEDGDDIVYVEEPGSINPFWVYDRAGEACRRCKTPIESFTQAGRTTYFCPKCQPAKPVRAKASEKRGNR